MIVLRIFKGDFKMSWVKFCRSCLKTFVSKREDAQFCSDRCAAAWARSQGYERENFHAEKDEHNGGDCEWCGNAFLYNDYANRGGERQAKFCSNKCRQSAYRARKAAAGQPAGYTGNWTDARNDKTHKGTSQDAGAHTGKTWRENVDAREKREDAKREKVRNEQSNKGTSQKEANKGTQQPPKTDGRWNSKDEYVILGVLRTSKIETIKRAWKKLLRTYHPDINKEPNAETICKKINWAWDRIENPGRRR